MMLRFLLFGYGSCLILALPKLMIHTKISPENLFAANIKFNSGYGGDLRKKRAGRNERPLSFRRSHHIVFKIVKKNLRYQSFRHPKNFRCVQLLLKKYSAHFRVRIEQISYQHDHIHIMAKSSRRSNFHNFFRVFSGQIAQTMKVTGTPGGKKIVLWKTRPFTRIVKGFRHFNTLRNYIQLNEQEVTGVIPYRKRRLRGLTLQDWSVLWMNTKRRDRYPRLDGLIGK